MLAITSLLNPAPPSEGKTSPVVSRSRLEQPSPIVPSSTTSRSVNQHNPRQGLHYVHEHVHEHVHEIEGPNLRQQDRIPAARARDSRHHASPCSAVSRQPHEQAGKRTTVARPGAATANSTLSAPNIIPKGDVEYWPQEDVDEQSRQQIELFRVKAFGNIRNNCEHIPYNSGKKDFYEKTGRESLEVFSYTFMVPKKNDVEYTVKWDYNIGLVRITDFFKAQDYAKTAPSKMFGQNEGLKAISPSITGGAIKAQGYWMPFHCAKAICATFCYPIAGALIPLFGPEFPSMCVPPDNPKFGNWAITQATITKSRIAAEDYKTKYLRPGPSLASRNSPPQRSSAASSPAQALMERREVGYEPGHYPGGATSHPDTISPRGAGRGGRGGSHFVDAYTLDNRIPDRRPPHGEPSSQRYESPYSARHTHGDYSRPILPSLDRGGHEARAYGGMWPATAPSTPTYEHQQHQQHQQHPSGWTPANARHPVYTSGFDQGPRSDITSRPSHSYNRSLPSNELIEPPANPLLSAVPYWRPTTDWEHRSPTYNTTRERANTGPSYYTSRPPYDSSYTTTENQPSSPTTNRDIIHTPPSRRQSRSPRQRSPTSRYLNETDQNTNRSSGEPLEGDKMRSTAKKAVALIYATKQQQDQTRPSIRQSSISSQPPSPSQSRPRTQADPTTTPQPASQHQHQHASPQTPNPIKEAHNGVADQKAALLLLNLRTTAKTQDSDDDDDDDNDDDDDDEKERSSGKREGECIVIDDQDVIRDDYVGVNRKRKDSVDSTRRRNKRRKGSVSSGEDSV